MKSCAWALRLATAHKEQRAERRADTALKSSASKSGDGGLFGRASDSRAAWALSSEQRLSALPERSTTHLHSLVVVGSGADEEGDDG